MLLISITLLVVSICDIIIFTSITQRIRYMDIQIKNLYKHIDEINSRIDKATDTYIAGRDIKGNYYIERNIREDDVRSE